jgi:tripartite-type tricarboxylate transporter receptor subunit TctC
MKISGQERRGVMLSKQAQKGKWMKKLFEKKHNRKTGVPWIQMCLGFLLAAALIISPLAASPAHSASFPKKRLTFIVPYSPGGGYDTYSRALSRVMPKHLPKKVDVIVRNITGAGGMTAMHALFRSKPDGHTIGIMNLQAVALYQALGKGALDPTKLSYLGAVARDPNTILVRIDSPYNTLEDLQKAKLIKYGATGAPSASWIQPKLAKAILKINTEVVTGYRGSSGYMTALIRGEVQAANMGVYSGLPYVKAKEAKVVLAFREDKLLKNIPVVKKGSPYEDMRLFGEDRVVAGPPGIPRDIHAILAKAFQKSIKDPQTQAWSKKTDYLLTKDFTNKDVLKLSKELVQFYTKYKKHVQF